MTPKYNTHTMSVTFTVDGLRVIANDSINLGSFSQPTIIVATLTRIWGHMEEKRMPLSKRAAAFRTIFRRDFNRFALIPADPQALTTLSDVLTDPVVGME